MLPIFNLSIPKAVEGVDPTILNPAKAWASEEGWRETATNLAQKFIANFNKFTSNPETADLVSSGPII